MFTTRLFVSIYSVSVMVGGTGLACGQEYPNKPIRIFGGGAGGSSDFTARIIAQGISGPLGQPVVVENRPPSLTPEIVAKSAPDGYVLHVTGSSALTAPFLAKVAYDPLRDFSPITWVTVSPIVLVVHPSVPVKSVKELIALAKARPGDLNYGSNATGGSTHLATELFKAMAGVNIVRIGYRGGGSPFNALVSGEVQVLFASEDNLMTYVKSGRLRALAVTSAEPSTLYPGLPTIAATGVPGYESVAIIGLWGPVGIPAAIINRLNQEIVRVLNRADVKEKFLSIGTEVVGSSPAQFGDKIKSEVAKWSKVIRDAGIRAE